MNPHARSATARCWSSPAGEGVLLVLSLARMRYGSPVMPWIGRYYAFCFWWLVTRDWWLGSHSSFVICRFARVGGHGSCTISYLTSGREDEVYKRDDFFLHLPDLFKDVCTWSSFNGFRSRSFRPGLHYPSIYKNGKMREKTNILKIRISLFRFCCWLSVVNCWFMF